MLCFYTDAGINYVKALNPIYLSYFVENVTAIQDVWFVGDDFLRETFDTFTNLRVGSKIQRKAPPYLYEMYNVLAYHQTIRSMVPGMVRILNAMVEGLNKRLRLPKFIVLVLDKDFIALTKHFEFGAYQSLKRCLDWLVKEINTILQRKTLDLMDKKPGAVAKQPPQIVWVKMLKRPNGEEFSEIAALRGKFNKVLEEVLFSSTSKNHFVLTINAEPADFTPAGVLNGIGKIAFWKEIDSCMRKFDRGEINLKPRPPVSMQRTSVVDRRLPRNLPLNVFRRRQSNLFRGKIPHLQY